MTTMAAFFDTLPRFEPDWTEEQKKDQLSRLDDINKDGTSMSMASVATARAKLADTFDWLPQSLKDMIDEHAPKSKDIKDGIVNKTKLTQAAEELFGKKMKAMQFINFYQLKAAVLRFGGAWGFLVTVDSGTALKCFFGDSCTKKKESLVSPSKKRKQQQMKNGCPFVIRSTFHPSLKGKSDIPRHAVPVRITTHNLMHGEQCQPSVETLRAAKRRAGAIFSEIDLSAIGNAMETIAEGANAQQIRRILRKYIPDGYVITSTDVHNIRARATKLFLEGSEIDTESAQKLVTFKSLDRNEAALTLPDTDLCRKKINELLRTILRTTDTGWKAKRFLELIKENSPGFDFRIHYDEDERPDAVVWMAASMRKNWLRYGNVIFLDAMKRKLNSLHWPYIGLVGFDNEKRLAQFCESLCSGEQIHYYVWVMQMLEDMEPRRKLSTVHLFYSDCFITEDFLEQLGLSRPINGGEGTDLVWDSFHLRSSVWPEKLGVHTYSLVKDDMAIMLYGDTRDVYDEAYTRISVTLANNPALLEVRVLPFCHCLSFCRSSTFCCSVSFHHCCSSSIRRSLSFHHLLVFASMPLI
jgi:hypothetical protein